MVNDLDVRLVIGRQLRALRLRARLSQTEVARRIGIDRPVVGRLERGRHGATLESCARFAAACNADVRSVLEALDRLIGLPPPAGAPRWRSARVQGRRVSVRAGQG